jgi:hypothetical protein
MCMVCSGTALAADPAASPDPLWKVYPLDIGGDTSTKPPPARPASTTPVPTPWIRIDQQTQQDSPFGAAMLLYAAIAGMVCAAYATGRQLRRRRSARSPTGAVRG